MLHNIFLVRPLVFAVALNCAQDLLAHSLHVIARCFSLLLFACVPSARRCTVLLLLLFALGFACSFFARDCTVLFFLVIVALNCACDIHGFLTEGIASVALAQEVELHVRSACRGYHWHVSCF